jgi:hypothetical protein
LRAAGRGASGCCVERRWSETNCWFRFADLQSARGEPAVSHRMRFSREAAGRCGRGDRAGPGRAGLDRDDRSGGVSVLDESTRHRSHHLSACWAGLPAGAGLVSGHCRSDRVRTETAVLPGVTRPGSIRMWWSRCAGSHRNWPVLGRVLLPGAELRRRPASGASVAAATSRCAGGWRCSCPWPVGLGLEVSVSVRNVALPCASSCTYSKSPVLGGSIRV